VFSVSLPHAAAVDVVAALLHGAEQMLQFRARRQPVFVEAR
jgi:hypothetical protein